MKRNLVSCACAILALALFTSTAVFAQTKSDQNTYNIAGFKAGATVGNVKLKAAPIGAAMRNEINGILGSPSHRTASAGPDANGVYHYDDGMVDPRGYNLQVDGFTELFSVRDQSQTPEPPQPVCRSVYHHLVTDQTIGISSSLNGFGSLGNRDKDYIAPDLSFEFGKMWKVRDGKKSDTFLGFDGLIGGSWTDIDGGSSEIDGTVTRTTDTTTMTHARELTTPLPNFPYEGTFGLSNPRVYNLPGREWFDHTSSTDTANVSGSIHQDIHLGMVYLELGPRLDHWIHLNDKTSLVLSLRGGMQVLSGFGSVETSGTLNYSVNGGPTQTKSFSDSDSDWDIAFRGYVGGSVGMTMGKRQQHELSIYGKAMFGQSLQLAFAEVRPDYTFGVGYTYRFGGK